MFSFLDSTKDISYIVINILYLIFNTTRVVSYFPQIYSIYNEKSSLKVISLFTWWFWFLANFSQGIYAVQIVDDELLATLSLSNAFCCMIVIILVIYKRMIFKNNELENNHVDLKSLEVNLYKDLNQYSKEIKRRKRI